MNHPFFFTEKLTLYNGWTPLERLPRFAARYGVELFLKRDDLTGGVESGNKIRKLSYLLYYALKNNYTAVMTCGAVTSNHARATAVASRRCGVTPYLLLRGKPGHQNANLQLMQMVGAKIRYCNCEEYQNRNHLMRQWAEEIDEKVYVIPEGGSNSIGIRGYVDVYYELLQDCQKRGFQPEFIAIAVGSGGSYAGLLWGAYLSREFIPILGFSVQRTPEYYRQLIIELLQHKIGDMVDVENRINIYDASYGREYGNPSSDELEIIHWFAQNEGIILDPVYTARAFNGFIQRIKSGELNYNQGIFIHTGGVFGLFREGLSPDRFIQGF